MSTSAVRAVLSLSCRQRLLSQLHQAWRPVSRRPEAVATAYFISARRQYNSSGVRQYSTETSRKSAQTNHNESDAPTNVIEERAEQEAEESAGLDLNEIDETTVSQPRTTNDVVRAARQEHGEHLPDGILNDEEYKIYERLYGPPRPIGRARNVDAEAAEDTEPERDPALFKKIEDGSWEEIEHEEHEEHDLDDVVLGDETTYQDDLRPALGSGRSARREKKESEDDERLQRDIAAAMTERKAPKRVQSNDMLSQLMEEMQAEYAEEEGGRYNEGEFVRTHPFTTANRFATSPSTLQIPYNDMVAPVSSLLSNLSNKHIDEAAAAAFGGPALPYATGSPLSSKIMPQKPIPLGPGQNRMTEMEADVYMAAIMPGAFAACTSILVELRKRLGSDWLPNLLQKEGGPRVLDVGAGGAGVLAWREVLKAEWMRSTLR